jgi:hypothetical protein
MSELHTEYRMSQALAILQPLSWLDDLWHRHLDATRDIPAEDTGTLGELGAELQSLLDRSVSEAEWLRAHFSDRAEQLDAGLARALDAYPLTEDARAWLRASFDAQGGFAATVQAATETVIAEAPEARLEMSVTIAEIEGGEFKDPKPRRRRLKCAILGIGAGIAIAAGQYSIAVSIVLHMNSIGCFGENPNSK